MKEKFLQHVAVIPDGNRRWARARGLHPWEGHRIGFQKRFFEVAEETFQMGISYFTFWAASEGNLLERSRMEVKFLVKILKETLHDKSFHETAEKNKVQVRCLGRWNEILRDAALEKAIRGLEEKTKNFTEKRLTVLFGYDGRREMAEAIGKFKVNLRPELGSRENEKFKVDYDEIEPLCAEAHRFRRSPSGRRRTYNRLILNSSSSSL